MLDSNNSLVTFNIVSSLWFVVASLWCSNCLTKPSWDMFSSSMSSFKRDVVLVLQVSSFYLYVSLSSIISTMSNNILIESCLSFNNIFSFFLELIPVINHTVILVILSLWYCKCFVKRWFDILSSLISSCKYDIILSFASIIVSTNSVDYFIERLLFFLLLTSSIFSRQSYVVFIKFLWTGSFNRRDEDMSVE